MLTADRLCRHFWQGEGVVSERISRGSDARKVGATTYRQGPHVPILFRLRNKSTDSGDMSKTGTDMELHWFWVFLGS